MHKILFFVFGMVFIFSCSNEKSRIEPQQNQFAQIEINAPQPDHSSPERLIKSLWQYKIWSDTVFFYDSTLAINKFYSDQYFKMNQNLMRERINDIKKNGHYIENNGINKIEKISDSLVNVYVDELEYPDDKNFNQRKYEIVKSNNGWSINNCFKQCNFCEGSGKDAIDKDLDCKYCNGKGWEIALAY
jgi:hypothetical protein